MTVYHWIIILRVLKVGWQEVYENLDKEIMISETLIICVILFTVVGSVKNWLHGELVCFVEDRGGCLMPVVYNFSHYFHINVQIGLTD